MKNIKNWMLLCLVLTTFACDTGPGPDPEPNWIVIIVENNWAVDQYSADGQSQSTGNVIVDFSSDGQYTLLIPQISDFDSSGTWTVNKEGTLITFNDGSQEIIAQSTIEEDGSRMVLTFQWSNFKAEVITYRIVLTR